jgi:diguanylate cyclase (GGDEF)-like protein/PAS domain S-box-containing protein
MSEYRLSDLLDMSIIQKLADSNFNANGLQMSIADAIDGSILVTAGWPGICTFFHRVNARSLEQCRISDNLVNDHLDKEVYQYRCNNGIWHIAMPIIVSGRHLATLFLTQFWFDGEVIDREYFINQAHEFGFDLDSYLEALDRMPVFSNEKVEYIVDYDKTLVRFISDLAEQSLRVIETQRSLIKSEKKFRTLFDNVPIGVYRKNPSDWGIFIKVNPAMVKIFGYDSADEFMQTAASDLYQSIEDRKKILEEIHSHGFVKDLELALKKKDGTPIWCSVTATVHHDEHGNIQWMDSVIEDITERKEAQEELQKAHDELEMRVQERTADLAEVNQLLMFEVAERKRFEEKLREISETDHLTNIYNRRKLFEIMGFEIEKSRRYARPLSLIMMDIDHFKNINDTYGHNIGDGVLMTAAQVVGGLLRKVDVFARYGGEEFIILCPETSIDGARVLAEKIRIAIEEFSFPVVGKVTVSAGIAGKLDENNGTALIEKADVALYAAKKLGRNRIEVAGPQPGAQLFNPRQQAKKVIIH